jgi:hypothetical protein
MCVKKTLLSSNYQMGFYKHIKDILYVAKFVKNMLSISQLIEQVFNVEFETNQFWLKCFNSNKVVVEAIQAPVIQVDWSHSHIDCRL